MASKFTIRPTPHLPINDMRIHPSLFIQEPGSNQAHYHNSTLEIAFESSESTISRSSFFFSTDMIGTGEADHELACEEEQESREGEGEGEEEGRGE